ncbi:MAG: hypothetical protein GXC76_16710 [Rhodanobacteraceae bacterium]|jgi:hypothetical protein|nr:hypothetical protein [Rhodanobacteraceae bacterium]
MKTFDVHYGRLVKGITAVTVVLLLGVVVTGVLRYRDGALEPLLMIVLPPVVLLATALFTVRRYEIDDDGLHVVRPIGRLRIARAVTSVAVDDAAGRRAVRTFGNGGLFSFNGWYWLPPYGRCRFWVTDTRHVVVLRGDRGCAAVSPAQCGAFVAAVKRRFGVAA